MNVAYVSSRCGDCTLFVRMAAGRLPLVYVEDASEIPWYIESVPTVVLETRDEDGKVGYDLYAGDDAFALIEPKRDRASPVRARDEDDDRPARPARPAPVAAPTAPRARDEGPCALGDDGAMFECVGSEDGMSCGAFEALAPLGTEDDRRRTENTVAEWERAVADERARSEKKETSKLERDFEQIKKERGN
jgi:hypothetical protein